MCGWTFPCPPCPQFTCKWPQLTEYSPVYTVKMLCQWTRCNSYEYSGNIPYFLPLFSVFLARVAGGNKASTQTTKHYQVGLVCWWLSIGLTTPTKYGSKDLGIWYRLWGDMDYPYSSRQLGSWVVKGLVIKVLDVPMPEGNAPVAVAEEGMPRGQARVKSDRRNEWFSGFTCLGC